MKIRYCTKSRLRGFLEYHFCCDIVIIFPIKSYVIGRIVSSLQPLLSQYRHYVSISDDLLAGSHRNVKTCLCSFSSEFNQAFVCFHHNECEVKIRNHSKL